MKTLKVILASFLMVAFCQFCFAQNNANAEEFIEVKYTVNDAVCGACESKIESALSEAEGIESYDMDILTKTLTVKYNKDKTCANTIKAVVAEAGYNAELLADTGDTYENWDEANKTKSSEAKKDCSSKCAKSKTDCDKKDL